MSIILEDILKLNKLIKSLINQEDIDGLNKALKEKNQLINKYNTSEKTINDTDLMKRINQLDRENMEKLNVLMQHTKENIQNLRIEKGKVKNKNSKVKKYKSVHNNSGYRFDRKK